MFPKVQFFGKRLFSDSYLSDRARVRPRPLRPKPVSCAILILIVALYDEKNDGSMKGLCGSLPRIANDKYATLEIE